MKRRLLIANLCLSGMLLLTGCASDGSSALFQKPSVSLASLTPKNYNNGELAFDIGLLINNPNVLPLPISDVNSQISLNGINFLSASGKAKQAIPANGTGKMTLSTSVSLDKIKNLVKTFRGTEMQYKMAGDIGVNALGSNMRLPFQQGGKINAAELTQKLIKSSLGR